MEIECILNIGRRPLASLQPQPQLQWEHRSTPIAATILFRLQFCWLTAMGHNSVAYLHTLIEAMRLSFVDGATYVADPSVVPVPTQGMISKEYAATRRPLIDPDRSEDFLNTSKSSEQRIVVKNLIIMKGYTKC